MGTYTFLRLVCDESGIAPHTFLNCLCVQPRLIALYGSPGSVGAFAEGAALQEIYSILTAIRGWMAKIHFTYPRFHKDYSQWGPWCAFQFTKVTSASPHTIQAYHSCYGFCMSKLLNPQPADTGQDALGLIPLYPRPDERFLLASFGGSFLRNPSYYAKRYASTYKIKYHI